MTLLSFDEMNVLASKSHRSMDIDKYFDEMILTPQQKKDRKDFAREMQNILFETMALIHLLVVQNISGTTIDNIKENLRANLDRLVRKFTVPDGFMLFLIAEYATNFVDITVRHSASDNPEDVAYWYSQDRARLNAEDEANTIFNYDEYRQAVFDGCTLKQWITMRDERVRKTHAEVDGETIAIDEPFLIGESLMMFPKDESLGATPDEVINCRCSIKYF